MTDGDAGDESSGNPAWEASDNPAEDVGDPFEQLEADVEGRRGDPFDRLDESTDHQEHQSDAPDDTTDSSRLPGVEHETSPGEVDPFGGGEREDSPFGGTEREGDPFENIGGAFEEMDVGGVDPERVWQDLASAEARGSVGDATERTYAEVSKHAYCEQCPFFSDPPDVECHHEGTELVEFLNMETVRVVDCPVVAERNALENE